jgi:hypothetical protein
MDNGSTDRTHQIMQELGCLFEVIPNVTVSALRNRGAAIAKGDFIAFIDADMELATDWLQCAMSGFEDPQVVASGAFPYIPKDATWVQRTWSLHRQCRQSSTDPTPVSWLGSANLIVRRHVFQAVAGFNEQLFTTEDVDLCYRLGRCGTILHNPSMKAIHWGEDPDLQTFWRKEVWRGIGNLKGLFSHGFRWDELPSVGYPLYLILFGLLFCLGLVVDILHQHVLYTPLGLSLLVLPSGLLALNTTRATNCLGEFPKLFLLYFIYGVARAYSIVKAGTPWLRSRAGSTS